MKSRRCRAALPLGAGLPHIGMAAPEGGAIKGAGVGASLLLAQWRRMPRDYTIVFVQQSAPVGLRSVRAHARPDFEELGGRVSALQHRTNRRRWTADHTCGRRFHDG